MLLLGALRTAITCGVLAHHGGTGDYDASRPLYVRGRVIQARYGFPHGLVRVEVPADVRVPRSLPGVDELRGRDAWRGRPVAEGAGEVRELLLPPDITGDMAGLSGNGERRAPRTGDRIAAIAYRRCGGDGDEYGGELRVQMLYAAGSRFRYRGSITRIVDRCMGAARPGRDGAGRATSGAGGPAAGAGDDGGPPVILLGGGAAVAAGFVAALIRLRTRRDPG